MRQTEQVDVAPSSLTGPTIAVVMPSFNARSTIEQSIQSILTQEPPASEVLVQDGQSNDGTLAILHRYAARVDVVSEPDAGQTDALNRALRRATGNIIGWLNADDLYAPGAFRLVVDAFNAHPEADIVYGDWAMIDGGGHQLRRYHVRTWDWERFLRHGCYVWSGATFFHQRVFERFGTLDPRLHCAMDLEYLLRIGRSVNALYVPEVLASFRMHNASKSGGIPLSFLQESHRVRWQYAGGSVRLQFNTLLADANWLAYCCTRRLWLSRAWAAVRPEKQH